MYQTIGEYLEYLELEKGLSQNTLDAYRLDLESFSDTLCVDNINSVDRLMINTYVRTLKEKQYAPTSIIRKVASLRGFFKWAASIGKKLAISSINCLRELAVTSFKSKA